MMIGDAVHVLGSVHSNPTTHDRYIPQYDAHKQHRVVITSCICVCACRNIVYHATECMTEAMWWCMMFKVFWHTPVVTSAMDARRSAIALVVATPMNNNGANSSDGSSDISGHGHEGHVAYATPVNTNDDDDMEPGLQLGVIHHTSNEGVPHVTAASPYRVAITPTGYAPVSL